MLDEIGRGTSTFDGLSIAWAVAEHLAGHPAVRPKTLFATHYHELTDLADSWPGVVNAHVAAREWKDDIVFLRKILPGRADRSYGIQSPRLAGLPARSSPGPRKSCAASNATSCRAVDARAGGLGRSVVTSARPLRRRAPASGPCAPRRSLMAKLRALYLDGTSRAGPDHVGRAAAGGASDARVAP